ncbi:MAG: hypothetical protein PVG71_10655 [Anaerolineae bacterium]|jgi:hypothetical protein
MSLLDSLALADWCCLIVALFLSLGPGYALLSLYSDHRDLESTDVLALSVGLSIACWSVLLAWLHGLGIELMPTAVFVLATVGWSVGLIRRRPWGRTREATSKEALSCVALWSILIATAAVGLYALRDTVVGPGSDSYHHSLIAHMIAERGVLPDSYEPFAPLTTFTYHFGFHGLVAALSRLSGIETVILVPVVGQLLNAAAALSVAFFTLAATRRHLSATVSAAFSGLVSVFPAFFINWGRYTQLTGLVLLPVFLGLVWHWLESGCHRSLIPLVGMLAAGTALAHYRVTLMAAVAVAVFVGTKGVADRRDWRAWGRLAGRILLALAVAGALIAPWAAHILRALGEGFSNNVGTPDATYFSLARLGPGVLSFPTNSVFIGLTIVATLLGLFQRQRLVIALVIWAVAVLFLSMRSLVGVYIDTISVIISLYFPASVAVGWAAALTGDWLASHWKPGRWAMGIGLLILMARGGVAIGSIIGPRAAYVGKDDLPAVNWIRSNTPESSYFMVNTHSWDFLPDYVIGSDAGYWLPLLADRGTITLPMTYAHERSDVPGLTERLVTLHRLRGHLTSPEAIALLRREGITHVYVGQRGGPIVVDELTQSPAFDLSYRNGSAYVFQLN